jgi:biopolymer transport protein ExbB
MNDLLSLLNPMLIFTSLRDFVETGGPVLLWIMAVAFFMWTLILERYWYFLTGFPITRGRAVREWGKRTERKSWYAHQIRAQMISEVRIEANRYIPFIKTLVGIAPFFGLLGTVTGMVEVFDVMAITGSGNARAMASGVSRATIPTMAGMVVAISGVYFASALQSRASNAVQRMSDELDIDVPDRVEDQRGSMSTSAMRPRRAAEADDAAIDLTPMLDIVFIMLIFFIVTAVFVRETGVDVNRPDAQTDQPKSNIAVLIAITEDNRVFIDGRQIEVREARIQIERLRSDNPKGPVIIQADEGADTGVAVEVMDQARLAGAPSISIATLQE